MIRPSGLAYDVGDPSIFEAELLKNPQDRSAIIRQHKKHLLPAQAGRRASQTASLKAQQPRGKLDDYGESVQDIIKRLVRNNPGYQPNDLWSMLQGELNGFGGELSEDEKTLIYEYKDAKKQ